MFGNSNYSIYLAQYPIDMRFGVYRLKGLVMQAGLNPENGDVVIFGGRNPRRIKILHGDSSGTWLSTKIFTSKEHRRRFKFLDDEGVRNITVTELRDILNGSKNVSV